MKPLHYKIKAAQEPTKVFKSRVYKVYFEGPPPREITGCTAIAPNVQAALDKCRAIWPDRVVGSVHCEREYTGTLSLEYIVI